MFIPNHLKDCTSKGIVSANGNSIKADIQCLENSTEDFEIFFIGRSIYENGDSVIKVVEYQKGFFLVVSIRFLNCNDTFVLLDKDLHGWNGWICRDEQQLRRNRPQNNIWKCSNCGESKHKGNIEIFSKGKEDFIEETEGEFDPELWYNAFSWFKMNIRCTSCGLSTDGFIDYETM